MSDIDVIERLRRINPVPEVSAPPPIAPLLERLDQPRRPAVSPRPWRRNLALGGTAAGGLLAAVIVLLASGGGTPNVAAEMYQATAPGSGVLHMSTLTEITVGGQTRTSREQFWSEQNPRRLHLILSDGESTLESALTTEPLKQLQWAQWDPGIIKQSVPSGIASSEQTGVQILRGLYSQGRLTLAGKTTFQGQPAWLLEVHPDAPPGTLNGQRLPNPTVVVSASTFVPLEATDSSVTTERGSPELLVTRTHYLTYEELPRNPEDEALLQLAPHPGASVKVEG
jgi:hypothetical protein